MTISETWHLFGPTHVPYRVLLLAKMIDRITAKQIRAIAGLSLAEWRVLAHVAALGEASASGISVAAAIDRAEASRAVNSLEVARLVSRRADPEHGKRQIIGLTGKGKDIHEQVRVQRRDVYKEITADLTAAEMEQFDRMLLLMALRTEKLEF